MWNSTVGFEDDLLKKRKVGKKEKRIKKKIKKRTIKTSINPLIRVKSTKKADEQPLTKFKLERNLNVGQSIKLLPTNYWKRWNKASINKELREETC